MSIYDKITVFITALILLALSFLSFGLSITTDALFIIVKYLQYLTYNARIELAFVGLLFFIVALYLLKPILAKPASISSVVRNTEYGLVKITAVAIYDLVLKSVKQINGVKSADVNIEILEEDKLCLKVALCVLPDLHIPDICDSVQSILKNYVEQTIGISVSEINVTVRNVEAGLKHRVE